MKNIIYIQWLIYYKFTHHNMCRVLYRMHRILSLAPVFFSRAPRWSIFSLGIIPRVYHHFQLFFFGMHPMFRQSHVFDIERDWYTGSLTQYFWKKHPAKNCWMIFLWPKRSHAPVEVNSPKKWHPYMTLAASKYPQQMIKHDAFRWWWC